MNAKMFNAVMKVMEDEPGRANIHTTLVQNATRDVLPGSGESNQKHLNIPPCGTVGCIAGWAALLTKKGKMPIRPIKASAFQGNIMTRAADRLDITHGQQLNLFYAFKWPEPFKTNIRSTRPGTKAHVKVIVSRMEHMLETGL